MFEEVTKNGRLDGWVIQTGRKESHLSAKWEDWGLWVTCLTSSLAENRKGGLIFFMLGSPSKSRGDPYPKLGSRETDDATWTHTNGKVCFSQNWGFYGRGAREHGGGAGVTVPMTDRSLQGLNLSQVLKEGEARLSYQLARCRAQREERCKASKLSAVKHQKMESLLISLHISAVLRSRRFPWEGSPGLFAVLFSFFLPLITDFLRIFRLHSKVKSIILLTLCREGAPIFSRLCR